MHLTKKIQIHPEGMSLKKLWSVSSLCTQVYNASLEQRRDRRGYGKVNVYSQKKELTLLKKELPEFKAPSSQVLQNVIFSLDRAYQMFFTKHQSGDKQVRPPRFRSSRYFFTQEYSQKNTSFDLSEPGLLRLSYGHGRQDWIELKVPVAGYDMVKTVKVVQNIVTKKWYACMTYEVPEKEKRTDGHVLYFDPGCKTALTGIKTSGEFFEYDFTALKKLNRSTYELIDSLKSRRAKKKNRNSHAFRRLTCHINVLFAKIKNRSVSYFHNLANVILKEHPDVRAFRIGDWDKRKTLADTDSVFVNRSINRAVQNENPLQKLIDILCYKAKINGQEVSKFDERKTTRTCSQCTHVHEDGVSPKQRIFKCEHCGFTFSRDHQSCLNFVRKFEPALWLRLPDKLSGRSLRVELAPFSFKPQRTVNQLITRLAS